MSWRLLAACKNVGISDFFAKRSSAAGQRAIDLCAVCPVKDECLKECLAYEKMRIGIRGGMSPSEREEHQRANEPK